MKTIVGLYSSSPQSGKSTVREAFEKAGFQHYSFADPVKQSVLYVLEQAGIENAEYYLYENKNVAIPKLNVTGGWLLSHYATDFWRDMVWGDIWLEAAKVKLNDRDGLFIIDDMRFLNEYKWVDCKIQVVRPDVDGYQGRSSKSEGNLDNKFFDYVIYNTGTIEELWQEAYEIAKGIKQLSNAIPIQKKPYCDCTASS